MKITINQIRKALLTNLLVVGLAACASTPAPWSHPDTSPWQGKRDTTSNATSADQTVSQAPEAATPAPEPLPAENDNTSPSAEASSPPAEAQAMEPQPQSAPAAEPAPMAPPPPPAESAAKPAATTAASNEQQIMSLPSGYYAVQAYAASTLSSVQQYKSEHHLDKMMAVKTVRGGKTIYVLVETFPSYAAAKASASNVKKATGSTPWVRSVAGLKKIVKQ